MPEQNEVKNVSRLDTLHLGQIQSVGYQIGSVKTQGVMVKDASLPQRSPGSDPRYDDVYE
jgi:hypothetical protein